MGEYIVGLILMNRHHNIQSEIHFLNKIILLSDNLKKIDNTHDLKRSFPYIMLNELTQLG
jgi:hypothetical protein